MINVTKTFFPPLEEYHAQLQRVWDNQWLTNRGALVQELETKLADYLTLQESKMIIMNNEKFDVAIATSNFLIFTDCLLAFCRLCRGTGYRGC